MPKNPKTISTENVEKDTSQPSENNEYFVVRVPKLRFKDSPLSPLWVILLLVFSFLLGMTTMKLQYTEETLNRAIAQAPQAQNEQNPGSVLGETVNVDAGSLPMLGSEDATVTIIEFSDFQCPYCKRFYDETYSQIKKDYVDTGKVRLAYRHMPLAIHPNAQDAGEASMCANDEGKFWEYHDTLFESFDTWNGLPLESLSQGLTTLATQLSLDGDSFAECLASNKYEEAVKEDMAAGAQAGVTGTPTFFINGKPLVGAYPYDTFKTIIEEELKN